MEGTGGVLVYQPGREGSRRCVTRRVDDSCDTGVTTDSGVAEGTTRPVTGVRGRVLTRRAPRTRPVVPT